MCVGVKEWLLVAVFVVESVVSEAGISCNICVFSLRIHCTSAGGGDDGEGNGSSSILAGVGAEMDVSADNQLT